MIAHTISSALSDPPVLLSCLSSTLLRSALARTRTAMPFSTSTSSLRVYQFHHEGGLTTHLHEQYIRPKHRTNLQPKLQPSLQHGFPLSRERRTLAGAHMPIHIRTGPTGVEPATSRVTVECSNQTELRPQTHPANRRAQQPNQTASNPIAPRGIEPLSAP
jgi:hypothetical protein